MSSETTTACVRLLVFFRIRRGTFHHGVEDDASTISLTPTTHYTNTCVKLTIVTHLSFSERIAIANLSFTTTTYILLLVLLLRPGRSIIINVNNRHTHLMEGGVEAKSARNHTTIRLGDALWETGET